MERKKKPGEIEIEMEDVEIIMGEDFAHLDNILNNVFCMNCKEEYSSKIENYKIYLNRLNDILFDGQCEKCKKNVARYLETGESVLKAEAAMHIRMIKKEFKTRKGKN